MRCRSTSASGFLSLYYTADLAELNEILRKRPNREVIILRDRQEGYAVNDF